MHNMALALQANGHVVSGSDDDVFDPSKSRLEEAGLLPEKMGWDANRITSDLDVVILGMHARPDNPELLLAQELGLSIQSFPEFVANHWKNVTRLVVAGSHGKTTTTAMIMHVLMHYNRKFDYLVGSKLDGFERMVQLSDAPLAIIEGDEYLSSPIDRRSKFHWYNPHIAIITGIAWDHVNVFPTYPEYLKTFSDFISDMTQEAHLIPFYGDQDLNDMVHRHAGHLTVHSYNGLEVSINQGVSTIHHGGKSYSMEIFGDHNFQNMEAAILALEQVGISADESLIALTSFNGTARRLEKVYDENDIKIFRDFAHSPSKVKATVDAVSKTFADKKVIAVFELHTFSSLSEHFLPHYKNSMNAADIAYVYYNANVFEWRKMKQISPDTIQESFGDVVVENNNDNLWEQLKQQVGPGSVLLLMSSGNFGNKNWEELVNE